MKSKRTSAVAAVGLVAGLILSACSSSKGGGDTGSTPAASPSAGGTAVQVTEKEFSIALAQQNFTAGRYTFQVHNSGQASHNLTVDGPGVEDQATSTLDPGGSGQVTVTLQTGTYKLYCSVDGHKDQGMLVNITVG